MRHIWLVLVAPTFWILINLAGIGAYLIVAMSTWNLDDALPGLQLSYGFINLFPFVYLLANLIWLLIIAMRLRRTKVWYPMIFWMILVGLWAGAIGLEDHMADYWAEKADAWLSDTPTVPPTPNPSPGNNL